MVLDFFFTCSILLKVCLVRTNIPLRPRIFWQIVTRRACNASRLILSASPHVEKRYNGGRYIVTIIKKICFEAFQQ